jgi:hypothetical protein
VDNAAYEAARRGIVPNATVADVQAVAQQVMRAVGANGVQVLVNPAAINNNTPQLTVTVNVPLDANGWISPHFFARQTMSGVCTMKREEF